MASYNTAFGQLPKLGDTSPGGTPSTQQVQAQQGAQTQQAQTQPAQTFSQMQKQGLARPAPTAAPQPQQIQTFGGSQQAQNLRGQLTNQLNAFQAAPSRYDTAAFNQIRTQQQGALSQEYSALQKKLNEQMARRGLSASTIGSGNFYDLGSQQSNAMAGIDAKLLQDAAATQAQDRNQLVSAMTNTADLAHSQDLATFEANRVAQATEFQQQLQAAGFSEEQARRMGQEALAAAQAQQGGNQFNIQQALAEKLGLGGLGLEEKKLQQGGKQFAESLGLQREQMSQQNQQFLDQLGLSADELALQDREVTGRLGISQQELVNQREQFYESLGFSGEELAERKRQFDAESTQQESQFSRQLKESQDARAQQFGLDTKELDLRARQIQNEINISGGQLSLDEARLQAEKEMFGAEIDMQKQQFGANLQQQKAEYLGQLGINLQQLDLDTKVAMDRAQAEGRALDLQAAELMSIEQRYGTDLAEKMRQFDANLAEDAAQFDLGLEEQSKQYFAGLDVDRERIIAEQKQAQSAMLVNMLSQMSGMDATKVRELLGGGGFGVGGVGVGAGTPYTGRGGGGNTGTETGTGDNKTGAEVGGGGIRTQTMAASGQPRLVGDTMPTVGGHQAGGVYQGQTTYNPATQGGSGSNELMQRLSQLMGMGGQGNQGGDLMNRLSQLMGMGGATAPNSGYQGYGPGTGYVPQLGGTGNPTVPMGNRPATGGNGGYIPPATGGGGVVNPGGTVGGQPQIQPPAPTSYGQPTPPPMTPNKGGYKYNEATGQYEPIELAETEDELGGTGYHDRARAWGGTGPNPDIPNSSEESFLRMLRLRGMHNQEGMWKELERDLNTSPEHRAYYGDIMSRIREDPQGFLKARPDFTPEILQNFTTWMDDYNSRPDPTAVQAPGPSEAAAGANTDFRSQLAGMDQYSASLYDYYLEGGSTEAMARKMALEKLGESTQDPNRLQFIDTYKVADK